MIGMLFTHRIRYLSLCLFLVLGSVALARASQLVVPDEFPTISDALEVAQQGDTVIVKPGTYYERIKMKEGVSLVSYAGDDGNELVAGPGEKKVLRRALRTIIDGSQIEEPGYLISFPTETTAPMRVDGFTFQNMPKYVSGVNLFIMEIRGCSPVVVNNIIRGNKSWGGILSTGLGIGMGPELDTEAKPIIRNNVVYNNMGPGIANGSNSAALVEDNEVFNNHFPKSQHPLHYAPGISVRERARPIIQGNISHHNGIGIGVINFDTHENPLIIRNNLVYANTMAGIGVRAIGGPNIDNRVIIENNKIYLNMEGGIRCTRTSLVVVKDNDIYENRKAGVALWSVSRALLEGNEIFGNYTSGIRLLAVPRAVVRSNHIYGNVSAGIDLISWEKR